MKNKLYQYHLYLLLLPVFYFLHNFNQLPYLIPFNKPTLFPFVKMLGGAIFLYGLCFLIARLHKRAAVITFLCLLVLWYFGVYHDALKWLLGENKFTSYKVVIPFTCIVLAGTLFYLLKNESALMQSSRYFTIVMGILTLYELIFWSVNTYKYSRNRNLIYDNFSMSNHYRPSTLADSAKPDIYLLVFDEYTNNTALRELWGFDNSRIANWLRASAFYVADSGKANYDFTPYSIASLLNMNYIEGPRATNGAHPLFMLQGVSSMSNNQVFEIVKKEGYAIRFFAPFNNTIETYNGVKEFNDFPYIQLYHTTLFYRVKRDILWNFPMWNKYFSRSAQEEEEQPAYGNMERRARDVFSTIKQIESTANSNSDRPPRFVYGHLMITHEPHLFDTAGRVKPAHAILSGKEQFDSYISQVNFANKIIEELVTYLLQNNKRNTIILLMGDHGFRHLEKEKERYHFPNFQAVYFPNNNYKNLYQTISPVNTFRVVFNNYFGQQFPLLKDSTVKVRYQLNE
jgi:hypothetical protein